MNGRKMIKAVHRWNHIPIIVIRVRAEARDKAEALETGADDYLAKSFSVDKFLAWLRALRKRCRDEVRREKGAL